MALNSRGMPRAQWSGKRTVEKRVHPDALLPHRAWPAVTLDAPMPSHSTPFHDSRLLQIELEAEKETLRCCIQLTYLVLSVRQPADTCQLGRIRG